MIFDDYRSVDAVCYDLKLGDYPRGLLRGKVNDLFNGMPPYGLKQVQQENIKVNFNDLTATIQGHDARAQLYSAFNKPGNYFKLSTDLGPRHKRSERGVVMTRGINRIMKRSLEYYECYRSKLALDVLHGVGPACWDGPDRWCPDPLGIEDVLVPSGTYLTLRNLDRFALYRSYSWPELVRLTQGPEIDPGWNLTMVKAILKWFKQKAVELMGNNWPAVWAPDKLAEGSKEDTGWYMGDRLPTLDVFDFYFWSDEKNNRGWYRRMILDAWNTPYALSGGQYEASRKSDELFNNEGFLYTSGEKKIADKWSQVASFQFADLSAVAPFRYHSIRSLGWLLYAPCMFQNILRCKFNTHVFENLMQYFRVTSSEEFERALKVELIDKGFVDESVRFIPQQERWQINAQVVQAAFEQWDHLIRRSSMSFSQPMPNEQDKTRKTAYQYQAEVSATAGLVGAAFEQAYRYQTVEYREIVRRFMKDHSTDPDVLEFRAAMLRQGIPEKMICPEYWEVEPERIMGAGNKAIETGIANWLMQYRPMYDPEPQRMILRQATLMMTDDPDFTDQLVPDQPLKVTDSVHDAELAAGALWSGIPVGIKTGMNHVEYIGTLLNIMSQKIQVIEQRGGMAVPQEVQGLRMIEQHVMQHLQVLAQDQNNQPQVKQFGQALHQMSNLIKAYEQRLAEAMQKQAQQGNGQMDPKDQAKIQASVLQSQTKMETAKQSHAQKTAQRQIQFEQQMQQDRERHQAELQAINAEAAGEIQREQIKTASEVANQKAKTEVAASEKA